MSLINNLKENINRLETTFGLWHGLTSTYAAEICAGAGFDWICIDWEHGPFELTSVLSHLQAIEPYETEAIVRPPQGDPTIMKQLLDLGARNFVVPMIETAQQAESVVRSVHYPPAGIRGVGTGLGRAAKWGRTPDYVKTADDQICLLLQVESVKGVENLESILKIDGVDGIFIGPADLSASMGYFGKAHEAVKEQITSALQTVRSYGKTAGILALTREDADFYRDKGANMIGVGVDTMLLARATSELAASFK